MAIVVLRAQELDIFDCLAGISKMDWDGAKGLCLCRAGGKENCDEKARFHGGHPVGATENQCCPLLPQYRKSPNGVASGHQISC